MWSWLLLSTAWCYRNHPEPSLIFHYTSKSISLCDHFFFRIVSSYCNIGLYQKIILSNIKWYPSKWYSLILFYNICQCWPIFPNTCEWAFPVWPFLYFRNFEFIPETTMEKFLVDVIIKWLSLQKAKNSICNFWYELWIL